MSPDARRPMPLDGPGVIVDQQTTVSVLDFEPDGDTM